jgi:Lipopolysaccharide-assembly
MVVTGCGYRVVGSHGGGATRTARVAVPVLVNTTNQTGIEAQVTSELRSELSRFGCFVLSDRQDADLLIEGKVIRVGYTPVAYRGNATARSGSDDSYYSPFPSRYRLKIEVSLRVVDIRKDKVLRPYTLFEVLQDFDYHQDISIYSANRSAAIELASKSLASDIALNFSQSW